MKYRAVFCPVTFVIGDGKSSDMLCCMHEKQMKSQSVLHHSCSQPGWPPAQVQIYHDGSSQEVGWSSKQWIHCWRQEEESPCSVAWFLHSERRGTERLWHVSSGDSIVSHSTQSKGGPWHSKKAVVFDKAQTPHRLYGRYPIERKSGAITSSSIGRLKNPIVNKNFSTYAYFRSSNTCPSLSTNANT